VLTQEPAAGGATAPRETIAVAIHHAYGSLKSFTVEGRVFEREGEREVRPDDSRLTNLWRALRALRVEEQKGAPLLVSFGPSSWELSTDDEGYFALRGRTPPGTEPGWRTVRVQLAGGAAHATAPLLVVPDGPLVGIISDVDDTVLVSEVQDRSRLLAHTLLENPLQREPVPGAAERYRRLLARNPRPDLAPVIYLTGSPRQLVPGIRVFLERNGFPPGAVVAKKLSDGGGDPLLDQARYKLAWIERLLEDLPEVRFVLSGDDGERDPEVYRAVALRHPERVEAVHIRRVSTDPARPTYEGQLAP
jgi:phosphatidate phosphatase APP1